MHPAPDDADLPVLTEIVLLGRAALPPGMARTAPLPELPIPWDAAYAPDAAVQAAPGTPQRDAVTSEDWPAAAAGTPLAYPGDTQTALGSSSPEAGPAPGTGAPPLAPDLGTEGTAAGTGPARPGATPDPGAPVPESTVWTKAADVAIPGADPERAWETVAVAATPADATPGPDAALNPAPGSNEAQPQATAPHEGTPDRRPDPQQLGLRIAQSLTPWLADRLDAASKQLQAQLSADLAAEITARVRAALAESAAPAPDDSARHD